ncbi:MAG: DUF2284 domain-containing protein [Syntrophorhabdaceae bacterium]
MPSENVPTNKRKTVDACLKGCSLYGRNGGCPPFSPCFNDICRGRTIIVYGKLLTIYYPEKVIKAGYYVRWSFTEALMNPLMRRIRLFISANLSGISFGCGKCTSCRKCAVKDGRICNNPESCVVSLESSGVLVTELMEREFDTTLQWWNSQKPEGIPDYMVKVIGFTTDEGINDSYAKQMMLESINCFL